MNADGDLPERRAARLILVSPARRVLLLRYRAEAAGDPAVTGLRAFWVTPGGGVEDGESILDCAVRELREETGIERSVEELGQPVAEREDVLWIGGTRMRCHETFYLIHVPDERMDRDGWTALERGDINDVRWFGADELRAADHWDDLIAPSGSGTFYAGCAEGQATDRVTRL